MTDQPDPALAEFAVETASELTTPLEDAKSPE